MDKLLDVPEDIPWVFDTETDGLDVIGPLAQNRMYYFGAAPLNNIGVCYIWTISSFTPKVKAFFESRTLIAHNIKFDIHAAKLEPKCDIYDTMLMVYHGDTLAFKSLDVLARTLGLGKIPTPPELKEGKIMQVLPEIVCGYLADDVAVTNILANKMIYRGDTGWGVQQQAVKVFAKAEHEGVVFLPARLAQIKPEVESYLANSLATLERLGFTGNLGSPVQVSTWLLDRGVKLPPTEQTKGTDIIRYSTNKLVLEKLAWDGCEEAIAIMEARKKLKLKQAFCDSLPSKMKANGRVYPQIHLATTKTGRQSYRGVNLQQVPKHDPIGKQLRSCFTGPRGYLSVSDYSQVEMRVAAALSGDETLLEIFDSGRDLHSEVACAVLGVSRETLDVEQRFSAKAINFGILNGMGAKRLSHSLRSDVTTAQRWLDAYLKRFHKLAAWMQQTWDEAEVYRITRTLSGRTRIFRKEEGVRSAVSVKVQGTAADLLYVAAVAVDEAGLNFVFSVHDEIAVDHRDHRLLSEVMEHAANNAFPKQLGTVRFKSEGYCSPTWQEPK